MQVSALILTRNRPQELLKCLSSIKKQTEQPQEIIILDNGSDKNLSLDSYELNLDYCTIYKSENNLGCPGGRNFLIEKSNYELLLFVDDDGLLDENAIKNGVNYFKEINDLAVVTFRIIDPTNGRIRDGFKIDEKPFFHHTFGGGSCIIKKKVLNDTGLYPTEFLRQGEESDLAIRIINSGYKIIYAPDCILYHNEVNNDILDIFLNSQLSTISTSWKYLPFHYAIARTIINYKRLRKYLKNKKFESEIKKEIYNIIKNSIKNRKRIKYKSYINWLSLLFKVKHKSNR